MSLPSLASLSDLNARLTGEVASGDETTRAQAALDDASALIRAEANTNWTDDADALEDVPDIIVTVCVQVAKRIFLNPEWKSSETLGSYAYQVSGMAGGPLELTKAERKMIRRAIGQGALGAITLESPYAANSETVYLDVSGTTEHFPVWDGDGY